MSQENVKKLAQAIEMEKIAIKVRNAKLTMEARSRIKQHLDLELNERIGRVVAAHRAQLRKYTLGDLIDHRIATEEHMAETLWDAAKLIGHGVAKHIAPGATRTVGNVVTAIRKKKKKFSLSKVPKDKATKAPKHTAASTEPVKMDRHSFNKLHKAAGGDLKKMKL